MYFDDIDFTKVEFCHVNNDEYPTMANFYWNTDSDTIRKFIAERGLLDDAAEAGKFNIESELSASFCLAINSEEGRNYALDLIVNDEADHQVWLTVSEQFHSAREWTDLIPDYANLEILKPFED